MRTSRVAADISCQDDADCNGGWCNPPVPGGRPFGRCTCPFGRTGALCEGSYGLVASKSILRRRTAARVVETITTLVVASHEFSKRLTNCPQSFCKMQGDRKVQTADAALTSRMACAMPTDSDVRATRAALESSAVSVSCMSLLKNINQTVKGVNTRTCCMWV